MDQYLIRLARFIGSTQKGVRVRSYRTQEASNRIRRFPVHTNLSGFRIIRVRSFISSLD
jgi:hypothetical protein